MAEVELPELEELEEKKKVGFGKRVALVTAMYAVALAITSLGGNSSGKELMLSQLKASDQWSYYQSKAMREHLYKTQRLQVEAMLYEKKGSIRPEARANYEELMKSMSGEEGRYASEKKEIEQESKKLEEERNYYLVKDRYFDYAEGLLQVAIVMASISILAGSMPVFVISLAAALSGSVLSLNGYLLLFRLPFIH